MCCRMPWDGRFARPTIGRPALVYDTQPEAMAQSRHRLGAHCVMPNTRLGEAVPTKGTVSQTGKSDREGRRDVQ